MIEVSDNNKFQNGYLFILVPIFLRILTVILFKEAALSMSAFTITNILTNYLYIICFVVFFLRAITWQHALKSIPLSLAYNFQSLTYVGLLIVGYLFFDEKITTNNIIGSIIIITGVLIIAKKEKNHG